MNQKIIQITAGRGPAECCWVVAQVLKCFLEDVQKVGLTYTILQRIKGIENGTVQSVTIKLEGNEVTSFASSWLGTVQWIGTSTFRKYHKRKNWFIGIYELDLIPIKKIAEKDIVFQTMRSSGPGGQHVNKVNSAVRATHKPTGTIAVAMDSRSQHQNKKIAIERLKTKVVAVQLEQLKKSLSDEWENHLNVLRGNPIRVFKGTDFKKKKEVKTFKNKRNQLKNDLRNQLKN
ncbi:peptide chain release factor [Aquimarina sp. MAR_2010_214]|uniref:peptide chain release factor H n=1 Tax=Aquimarina sp. MAR_2010_214 TaxID=1250026 RepID=UPI000C7004BD|nr:peptide chain release factor H [Aquimarina sp. MAR_2010_214]PKV53088.1 peptide chain release factor [Aquimarina sp. MAR_2010_214]